MLFPERGIPLVPDGRTLHRTRIVSIFTWNEGNSTWQDQGRMYVQPLRPLHYVYFTCVRVRVRDNEREKGSGGEGAKQQQQQQ